MALLEPRPDVDYEARRDIAGNVVAALVSYVVRACGEDGARQMCVLAGEWLSVDELRDGSRWFPRRRVVALAEAAAIVTGDEDIGRRAGEELMRSTQASGVDAFIRAAGSPGDALVSLVAYGSKMAQGREIVPLLVGDREVILEGKFDGLEPHPFLCSFGPGFWAQVPALFGAIGTVVEEKCQRRGDDSCIYHVRWDVPVETPEAEILETTLSAEALIGAFESLQATASELARAESLEDVLQRIAVSADRALVAPRFLAAVRDHEGRTVVAGHGLTKAEAEDCARRLLADPSDTTYGTAVIAPLASKHEDFGIIAALMPVSAQPGPTDERLLAAYAGHATAVLDAVVARASAERNDAVSRGLLDLAQRLAAVASPADVCARVVTSVIQMIECPIASIWRWDEDRRLLDLAAHSGPSVRYLTLTESDLGGLSDLGTNHASQVFDIDTVTAPKVADEMARLGMVQSAVAPVVARGRFLGLVSVGFSDRRSFDEGLKTALLGLADLAATALDNAMLVEHIRHQSLHDALTGLPNRPLIEDRVHQAIRSATRAQKQLALMFIDLDRFKNVNDTLGHTAGDALIRQASMRLASAVRAEDTLARMGGDEFVLLLPNADQVAARAVADKVIESLREPFKLNERQLYISCSIGIAVWPSHGADYEHLLLNADAAMYEAKAQGRNTYAFHSGMTTRRRELLDLEHRLHTAIERNELAVLYQPQVDLVTMRVTAVEALVRWDHPELGRLTPDRFLHLAEESGVITRIDAWVRSRAFAQAHAWARAGTPVRVSVNLSAADLRRADLVEELRAAIDNADLDPRTVELEITDHVALGENDLRPVLESLATLGVRLAVDDFGVGSSVLGRLQHGPFDTLKIDRSLVCQVDEDPRQAAILQALVTMGRELGLTIVAEGVETPAQADVVRRFGCDLAQGWLFGRPADAAAIDELVRTSFRGAPLGT